MLAQQGLAQTFQSCLRVIGSDKLIWTGASLVRNRNRLSSPDQLRAAATKALPAAERVFCWIAIGRAVPALHGLNGDSICGPDPAALDRFCQRRVRSGEQLAITRDGHT